MAPRATRMATSCDRPTERANRRFATLAQAMSRISATAPESTKSVGRRLPTVSSRSGVSLKPRPLSSSGYSRSKRTPNAESSACACSRATPGRSLATTSRYWLSRFAEVSSAGRKGCSGTACRGVTQICTGSGWRTSDSITPATWKSSPLSVIVWPTMPGQAE